MKFSQWHEMTSRADRETVAGKMGKTREYLRDLNRGKYGPTLKDAEKLFVLIGVEAKWENYDTSITRYATKP